MNKFYILVAIFLALNLPLNAQKGKEALEKSPEGFIRCYTTEMTNKLAEKNAQYDASYKTFENWLAPIIAKNKYSRTDSIDIVIPVVIHIIHDGDPVNTPGSIYGENISYEQAVSQIKVLNEDFNRMMGTPGYDTIGYNLGVNSGIRFQLANIAPDGSATNGVDRVTKCKTNWSVDDINDILKPATIWDPTKYLNIWSVRFSSSSLLGYAQFPVQSGLPGLSGPNIAETDGVVANYKAVGTLAEDDGSFVLNNTYNEGRTLTHEVGHWLGLRHIWGDGGCGVDDFCEDTPDSDDANYGCPTTHESCGSIDMVENYMDYTDDYCMNTFTQDQKDRMHAVLTNSPRRKELIDANVFSTPTYNLDAKLALSCIEKEVSTPCNPADAVTINFDLVNTAPTEIYAATISYGIMGENMSNYTWSGSLKQYEVENIALPFDTELLSDGVNQIQVKIENINNATDEVEANNVLSIAYEYEISTVNEYTENQFILTIEPDSWASELSWKVENAAGDEIVSGGDYPNGVLEPIIETFELAANDCYTFYMEDSFGDGIITPGYYTLETISNQTIVTGGEFDSVDATTFIIGSLGVNDLVTEGFKIYPNPAKGVIFVKHNFKDAAFKVSIYNLNGQLVYNQKQTSEKVNIHNLKTGVYIIQIEGDDKKISQKLIIK